MEQKDLLNKMTDGYGELVGYNVHQEHLVRILSKKGTNNPIIVGDSGVGKTALAVSMSRKTKSDFYILKNDALADVVFSYQPNKEDLRSIKEIFSKLSNAIVLIDDIAALFSDEAIFQNRLISLLTPLLTNFNVAVIATIDQPNFRLFVENNTMLVRYFEELKLFEPVHDVTLLVLKNYITQYEHNYNVSIESDLIERLISLADRFLQSNKQPAKSLALLDEVCAYVKLKKKSDVTINDVRHIISERTGIPVSDITVSDQEKLKNLEKKMGKEIRGQDRALQRVSKVIRRSRAGIQDPRRPNGSFLFLGPSGVGKTYLAKTLTKTVYGDEQALVRIDMSEFNESHNVQRLIGAPPGYVGYEEGGQLTNPVWERPYSLVLLDEIEKAHPRVFDIFLQLIDEGRLTDGQGKTVDFNHSIIIATSNIGIEFILEEYEKNPEHVLSEDFVQKTMMPVLLKYFRPEFINRFDDIVVFKPLDIADLTRIASLNISELNDRLKDKDISLKVSHEALEKLARHNFNPKFGARPVKRAIRENIEDYIAQKIIFGELKPGSVLEW